MYKILCTDGGGIKGALTARILERAEKQYPGILKNIDLFAGTSTGGIIATGLNYGLTPTDFINLYKEKGSEIFSPFHKDLEKLEDGISCPKYKNSNFKKILESIFKSDTTLKDLHKKILLNTFKLNHNNQSWLPIQLTNFSNDVNADTLLVDAVLQTSAAPVYFPSYKGFIDGGVFANNPSIGALANAIAPDKGKQSLPDIRLLSIGTGFTPQFIKGTPEWGSAEWLNPLGKPAVPLISILMDGVSDVDDYNCQQLLGSSRYWRINPQLDKSYGMDDWKHVDYFIDQADKYITNNPQIWDTFIEWLEKNF